MIDIILLCDDRYLGVAWKNGQVHNMLIATHEAAAYRLAEDSLRHKPAPKQLYENIEALVKPLIQAR